MENSALDIDKNWSVSNKPFRFFGPCSAESPEQLEQTAAGIHQYYPEAIFRAGVWKPRTRPNSFEGIGEEALEWLKAIKAKHHFPIAIEVANVQHLEKALEAGVDMLWIGARTTVNPFSVQAIADGLKGVDVPVFVKNPINPDLSLWIGALERINKAGITKLGAIHRGFHLSDNGPYRNYPYWSLAVQLKAEFPNLPIVCDASHISGKPGLIPQVSQKAYDLDMDGIMIETHFDPNLALSDKEQQLTPEQLHGVLSKLIRKRKFSSNEEFKNQLEILRTKIDKVDDELMDLIAVRMDIAKQIGIYKKNNKVTILQIERWKQILSRVLKNGKALDLSEDFINALFNSIHDESIRQQTLVQNGDSKDA